VSNWREAVAALTYRRRLDDLVCPKCTAMNRPRAHLITLEDGLALCSVCGASWAPAAEASTNGDAPR
jgi:ribosomal protein L40E